MKPRHLSFSLAALLGMCSICMADSGQQSQAPQKLYKDECKICRIAPLCGGGCRQRAFESMNTNGCSMGYSETDIQEIVSDIFEYEFNL